MLARNICRDPSGLSASLPRGASWRDVGRGRVGAAFSNRFAALRPPPPTPPHRSLRSREEGSGETVLARLAAVRREQVAGTANRADHRRMRGIWLDLAADAGDAH